MTPLCFCGRRVCDSQQQILKGGDPKLVGSTILDKFCKCYHVFFLIFFNVYLFLRGRKRQSVSRAGAEREGETECEAGFRLRAVSTEPDAGLELTDRKIMT